MIGALVFIIFFIIFVEYTLNVSVIPPGPQIYQLLNVPETNYPVLGYPATLLVEAVFNGVVYGFIAWLIFSLIMLATKEKKIEVKEVEVPSLEENIEEE